jgi:hypothetical protein
VTPSAVVAPGRRVDLVASGTALEDGELLSVAEIQEALHNLRARRTCDVDLGAVPEQSPVELAIKPSEPLPATESRSAARCADDTEPARGGVEPDPRWVCVIAAHAGAGASTVALAIVDAASTAARTTNLVETAHPTRSGLVAATNSELGLDASGVWRRGSRGRVTIDRRAGGELPTGWPILPQSADGLIVVDLGLPTPDSLERLAVSGCRIVVVCRPTVPGVRRAEHLLTVLPGPVIVASVGGGRWPGEVNASLGPHLRDRRGHNAVVAVPTDRHFEVTGPTSSSLPKSIAAAGRSLLALIDARSTKAHTAPARSTARRKGTPR